MSSDFINIWLIAVICVSGCYRQPKQRIDIESVVSTNAVFTFYCDVFRCAATGEEAKIRCANRIQEMTLGWLERDKAYLSFDLLEQKLGKADQRGGAVLNYDIARDRENLLTLCFSGKNPPVVDRVDILISGYCGRWNAVLESDEVLDLQNTNTIYEAVGVKR